MLTDTLLSSGHAAADVSADVGETVVEPEERALIAAARSDPRAFGLLYQRYLPRIYRYLRLRCSNDADAADMTQDVFVRALAALPRYRDNGLPFAAWLFTIARNRSADAARRSRSTGLALQLGDDHAGGDDLEGSVVRREAIVRVERLLARLEPDKRELLALRFASGLTSREIARVVGRSEPAVKQQLTRLLRNLKEQSRDC
jgi:RNA polymerase sigma-70 factor (ECF subfamily)